jgi:hypothetical protein
MKFINLYKRLIQYTLCSLLVGIFPISCKKFLEINPPKTQISGLFVFESDVTAESALMGIYSQMMTNPGFASGAIASITYLSGLSADEFKNYASDISNEFYTNSILPSDSYLTVNIWGEIYQYIYSANAVIEGVSHSVSISAPVKKQLEGEAKFIRAFCHFYLVNLFGDIPLVVSTNYLSNSKKSRTAAAQVWQQIITDLKDAQNLLSDDYTISNGQKVRPNKGAATAMLARAYLYTSDWLDAEAQATAVINATAFYSLDSNLNSVFLANSTEAIWQLFPVSPGINTNEGNIFILTPGTIPANVTLSDQVLAAFEINDNRKLAWVDSISVSGHTFFFPFKYKVKTGITLSEYSMVLRLAEQYLIRAEARAEQNNLTGSVTDLNIIRKRAGLPNTTAMSQPDLLTAILHERQVELFTEWGHRWLDLKRTNNSNFALGPIKSPGWQPTDTLYPIPQSELLTDPNLVQNAGY